MKIICLLACSFFDDCLYLAVLENVVFDEHTREVDYSDKSVTGKDHKQF
jgi:ATP-dependent phosphoenolpyruvate carboxykinase